MSAHGQGILGESELACKHVRNPDKHGLDSINLLQLPQKIDIELGICGSLLGEECRSLRARLPYEVKISKGVPLTLIKASVSLDAPMP